MEAISSEDLERLAGMYVHACFLYGEDPLQYTPRKQKRVQNWLCKHYIHVITQMPDHIQELFSADRQVFFEFLASCNTEARIRSNAENYASAAVIKEFPENVQHALTVFLEFHENHPLSVINDTIQIEVECCSAYRLYITLPGAQWKKPVKQPCWISGANFSFAQQELGKYLLYGCIWKNEKECPLEIVFDSIVYGLDIFNAAKTLAPVHSPWDILRSATVCLRQKAELPGDCCSSAEKELLPVLDEISDLSYSISRTEPFYLLESLAQKHGHSQLAALLRKLVLPDPKNARRRERLTKRVLAQLAKAKYEGMWREIYEAFRASQAGLPGVFDVYPIPELSSMRQTIEDRLKANGFEGTYPDFQKNGSIRGLRLTQRNGLSYFVFNEKRARYFIHCQETLSYDCMHVHFLCGTALQRKTEDVTDVYACAFDAKGRRYFRTLSYGTSPEARTYGQWPLAALYAIVAAKCAQLEQLTRVERKIARIEPAQPWSIFFFWLLFGGGLFSILFHLFFFPAFALFLYAIGDGAMIPGLFTDTAWLKSILFAWVGFGGAMGIVSAMASRK